MDFITQAMLDQIGAVSIFALTALLVITDKLVWHKRLSEEKERADRWETVALEALQVGASASVSAAETAASVVSALPDPVSERRGKGT